MYIFTRTFWAYAFERMIKTVAQAAVAVITAEAFGLFDGRAWLNVLSVAGMAGLVSVLMSLQAYSEVNNDSDMKALEATVARITRKAEIVKQSAETVTASPLDSTVSHHEVAKG